MSHLTITNLGDELIGTYDDGKYRFIVKQKPTNDFLFDCACLIDTISLKISLKEEEEKYGVAPALYNKTGVCNGISS